MKVLLSIKPQFVGEIVGELDIEAILEKHPKALWEKTKNFSGISADFYDSYFMDREKGYAIKIKSLNKYDKPRCPHEMYGNFTAPLSFKYVI